MKNNEYPSWLVPLEIAKKLKRIGFNECCVFYTRVSINDTYTPAKNISVCNDNYNRMVPGFKNEELSETETIVAISLPTWEQVFEWFRSKRFMITLINYEDESKFSFYNMKIRGGVYYAGAFKTYEQAQEALVYKLIEIYKSEQNENLHLRKD